MQRKWLLTISTLFFLTPAISSHSLSYNNPLHSTTPPHAISSEHNIFYVNHGGNGGNGANGGNGGNGLNNGNGGDGAMHSPAVTVMVVMAVVAESMAGTGAEAVMVTATVTG